MSYPTKIREHFSRSGGLNLLLVKTKRPSTVSPPTPDPVDPGPSYCVGATNQVKVLTSYRGSDWGEGINHAIRIGSHVYNANHEFKLYSTNGESVRVGPYKLHLNYLDIDTPVDSMYNRTILTINVEPTLTGKYIEVTLIGDPTSDPMDNTIRDVIGGGQITYGDYLIDGSQADMTPDDEFTGIGGGHHPVRGVKFCLKPNKLPPLNCAGANNVVMYSTQVVNASGANAVFNVQPTHRVHVDGIDYGIVTFSGIKEHQFGDVRIKSETDIYQFPIGTDSTREDKITIVGGTIGIPHKVKIETIPDSSMVQEGSTFRFYDMTRELKDIGNPTTIIAGNIIQFCLAAVGRCYNAPDTLLLYVNDEARDVGAVMNYRLVINDVDYGVVDILQGGNGIPSILCGEWDISFSPLDPDDNEISVTVTNGYKGSPVHFKLIPVAGSAALLDTTGYQDPTFVSDEQTGIVEFCIEKRPIVNA